MITKHLESALRFQRRVEKRHFAVTRFNWTFSSSYVTSCYLLVKSLNIINTGVQFYLLNIFLRTGNYSFYGYDAIRDILNQTSWEESGKFPRVTLCDFEVRQMGNIQPFTVQCVLIINVFNEKIFTMLWFWYSLLLLVSLASLIYWASVSLLPFLVRSFVVRNLELADVPFDPKRQIAFAF